MSRSKLVQGIGINDSDCAINPVVNGRRVICQFYLKWTDMLKRCYSDKYQEKNPTYIGCSVCNEWRTFSNFKQWMELQDWKLKALDKDLLIEGNKLYSPETCVFVDTETNNLLTDRVNDRGDLPLGVSKRKKSFRAQCSVNGKQGFIGTYPTPEEAHQAYLKFKSAAIIDHANSLTDVRVKKSLIRKANKLKRNMEMSDKKDILARYG